MKRNGGILDGKKTIKGGKGRGDISGVLIRVVRGKPMIGVPYSTRNGVSEIGADIFWPKTP